MANPFVMNAQASVFNQYLAQLRDEVLQQDRHRFRLNLARCAELMAYELSKQLPYTTRTVHTPLGETGVPVLAEQPVLVSILRAALPMHDGFLRVFDEADSGFVSAYRKHHDGGKDFEVRIDYRSAPDLTNRTLILLDPMIATGRSMSMTYDALVAGGQPKRVFIVGIIASEQGLEHLSRHVPNAKVFVGAVDSELTSLAYIVPGLGDAGDLAFGPKGNS